MKKIKSFKNSKFLNKYSWQYANNFFLFLLSFVFLVFFKNLKLLYIQKFLINAAHLSNKYFTTQSETIKTTKYQFLFDLQELFSI